MSVILNGIPSPRFVLYNASGVVQDDFTLGCFRNMSLDYEPDILRHTLQDGRVRWKLRGFRMKAKIDFENVQGEELQKMHKLLDRRAYASAEMFPWSTDKPFYKEKISLDNDSIALAYESVLLHKAFTLIVVSEYLLDYVPMEDADFISWGNITLQFSDLNALPYTSYMRTITMKKSGGAGTVTGATTGFFKDGATELHGGSKVTTSNTTFQTDVTTTCMFTASGGSFVKWQVNGIDSGTQPTLNLAVMADVTVNAVFA